jgi:hypothetical protein
MTATAKKAAAVVAEVIATAHPPAGRRRYWALIVVRCVHCAHLHQHRATGPHGGLRVGSCGRPYRVVIAGAKRARWAS